MVPTLIIMAAGMGQRYGGLKQIVPVGPSGEFILDYSVYDAILAGFGRIILVVAKGMEPQIKEAVGDRIAGSIRTDYACQCLEDMPDGMRPPAGRKKPWGTAHAVYCCRNMIDGPFAVINADDFYGRGAFTGVSSFLKSVSNAAAAADASADAANTAATTHSAAADASADAAATDNSTAAATDNSTAAATDNSTAAGIAAAARHRCCMAGYRLEDTMTGYGHVARGVCEVSEGGYLAGITERTRIEYRDGAAAYTEDGVRFTAFEPGTVVSMNMWGFPGGVAGGLEGSFRRFLSRGGLDTQKDEFFLPAFVGEMIDNGSASVKVLETGSKWYGVTYREDTDLVISAVAGMVKAGVYPRSLW